MKKLFTLMAAVAAMVSCSENVENTPTIPETDKLPINISTTLTRATDSAFEAGDKVGIFVVNEPKVLAASGNHVDNMGFTYSTTWTPDSPIYWLDKTTKADFYCYYPYGNPGSVTAYAFSTYQDQTVLTNYKASDFIWGKATGVAPTADLININTNHVLSNAIIYLRPGDGFTAESFAAAQISVGIRNVMTNAYINLSTGKATATGSTYEVKPYFEGDYYRAVIVPQTVADGSQLIVVTVNGVDYALKKGFTFLAGKQHKFTVNVNKTGSGVNVGVGDWEEDTEDNGGDAE